MEQQQQPNVTQTPEDPFEAAFRAVPTTAAPAGGATPPQPQQAPVGPKPDPLVPLSDPTSFLDSMVGGASNALLQTKDFILGKPDQKSQTRQNIEKGTERLAKANISDALVSNLTQFAVGMLGAGKVQKGLELLPKVANAMQAGGKAAVVGTEAVKAATVGAVAFDPHQERLSNLVQSFPALSNPVTEFLEAKKDDSAALGRTKAALESIGLDGILIGTFLAGTKVYKAIRGGDSAQVQAASKELEQAVEQEGVRQPGGGILQDQTQYAKELEDFLNSRPVESANDNTRHLVEGYHGTTADFEKFSSEFLGDNTNAPSAKQGFFFSKGPDTAHAYGPKGYSPDKDMMTGADWAAYEGGQRTFMQAQDAAMAVRDVGIRLRQLVDVSMNGKRAAGDLKLTDFEAEQLSKALGREIADDTLLTLKDANDLVINAERAFDEGVAGVEALRSQYATPLPGANIRPVRLQMDNPYIHDFGGKEYREVTYNEILKKAKAAGHDSAILKNTADGGPIDDIYVVFTPEQIVSKYEPKTSTVQGTAPLKVGEDTAPAPASAANDAGVPPQVEVSQVNNATQAGAPARTPLVSISDEQLNALVDNVAKDAEALRTHSSWNNAVAQGHTFSGNMRIPWQKIVQDGGDTATSIQAMVDRVADILKPQLDAAKGGDVMSDARVARMVAQRAALWGEDPAALMGLLQAAGKNASTMAANMEAAYVVAQRSLQDSFTLGARIAAGDLSEFAGNKDAAIAALKQMLEVSASAYGAATSMSSNAGRALRRMRTEFQVTPDQLKNLQALDGDMLLKLVSETGGDPRQLARIANPSMWQRALDTTQWMLVNNLLWGWRTHAVNLTTNAYMMVGRPMERFIGSAFVGGADGRRIRSESLRQYTYLSSTISDSWKQAKEAWTLADSPLMPHSTEALDPSAASNVGTQVALAQFKSWDSLPNVLANAVLATGKAMGTPTRALGVADEFVKQTVYRSKVLANAHVEGVEAGLTGQALTDHVTNRLYSAFDDAGRAVDGNALKEAQVATFQQPLIPGTFGFGVQSLAQSYKPVRFIVPFIRTPTNVIRMGVKLTPGLNVLQTEYRQMIAGKMGVEAQAQAVGQMALGGLFMSTAAMMAVEGRITGGGPSDPKLRKALTDTGWQPYSYVHIAEDGTRTYVPYGRFDPIGLPFGIVADLIDANHNSSDEDSTIPEGAAALLMALTKNITQKTYLRGVDQAIQAMSDPDKKADRFVGQFGANLVPFSSALRQANPDPYMREAREFVDHLMKGVPGLSDKLPPQRDVWGEPVTVNKGLWVTGKNTHVDHEVRRMAEDYDVRLDPPAPNVQGGVDLRDIKMVDGKNAYDVYQQLAVKPTPRTRHLKDVIGQVMLSEAYKNAPDGAAEVKGTKLYMLTGVMSRYRQAALLKMKTDLNVRTEMLKRQKDVASHYAAQKPNPTPANQEKAGLGALGDAFGVDLSGIASP